MKKNFIANEWVIGNNAITNINPSDTSDIVGEFTQATPEQVSDAIAAAHIGGKAWAATGLEKRYTALTAIGNEMMARSDELGELLSKEEGKPFAEGKGEWYRAGQFFTYYGAEVLRQLGENADSVRDGIEIDVRREPVGTVAIISPWNFPVATASWKIAPALAFGNAVIWKPANITPASAVALAEIIAKQDLPAGAFNLVMGGGASVGQALVDSRDIQAISFTGSVDVGRTISTAAKNFTKVQLEMGSKNALAVMDDADIDLAVSCAVGGAFGGTGQKCTASSRVIVHEKIYNEFVDKFLQSTKNLKVGHALDKSTTIGPVVSEAQLKSNLNYIELGKKEGATLQLGGDCPNMPHNGYYMNPAVFTDTSNDMQINRDEMFAPIACIIKTSNYDEALSIVNDTDFGLTSGIITQSLAKANHFRRNAKTGCVMVNLPTAGTDYHVPFGGRGQSSYGSREQGRWAVEFYTTAKTAYISAGNPK